MSVTSKMTDYSQFRAVSFIRDDQNDPQAVEVDDLQCMHCFSILASGRKNLRLYDLMTLADSHRCVKRTVQTVWTNGWT